MDVVFVVIVVVAVLALGALALLGVSRLRGVHDRDSRPEAGER